MKHFSSSILSVNKSNKNTPITLESFKENNFSYRTILEFNEEIAKQDETCSRGYYMALIDHIKGHVSNFDPAYTAIFNYYDAVSSAVKGMLSANNMCCNPSENVELEKELGELVYKFKKDKSGNVIKFIGFSKTPINSDSTTILMPIRTYCDSIINGLKADKFTGEVKDIVADICRFVSKANGLGECNSIEEYIHNYEKYFEFRELEVLPSTADNLMYSVMETNGNIYMCAADLDGYALCDIMINMLKNSTDKFDDPNVLKSIVQNLCDGLVTYAIIIAKCRDINDCMRAKIMRANIASLTNSLNGISTVREGMEMFGDEINSDDLFADLTDFQPSMFRNIDLEAESEFLITKKHIARHAMAMEAQCIAEGRLEDLPLIEAAVAQKTKDAISNLLEAIRNMMTTFLTNIQSNAKKEVEFLRQNKETILNNPLDPNTKLTFYSDLIKGYERLQKGFKIPVLRFDELKEELGKDGVDPEVVFFDKYIKEYVGQDFKRSDKRSLADDLKYYWGFKDGNKYEKTANDLPNIADMYNWLIDTVNIASNMNIQAKNVDRTYNEYKRGKRVSDAEAQAAKQEQKPVNASYYSYIYQRDMLISEVDIQGNTKQDDKATANTNNQQSTNNTQQNTQNNNQQQKTGESTDKRVTRNMTTYCKVCRQVLSARATAFAYIHKEFMDICRYIVKNNGGDKAKKADTQPAQQAATNTNKQ